MHDNTHELPPLISFGRMSYVILRHIFLLRVTQMLMEAIIESLKAVEIRGENTTAEPTLDSKNNALESSSPLHDQEASSATETSAISKTDDSSASNSVVHLERPSSKASVVSSSSSGQTDSAPNIAVPPNEDADVSGKTKATVTVVKNPSSHILDGLLRRWDFNCFRGGR